MRRLVIGASTLAAVLVLGAAPVTAQFYIGAYATIPSGDFKDAGANTGIMGEVGYRFFQSPSEKLSLYVSGAYGMNGTDVDDFDYTQIMGLGQVVYDLTSGGSATPYLIGSVGYLSLKEEFGNASETEGGIAYGAGLGVGFAQRFWVEARYLGASIEESTLSQLILGGGISF